MVDRSPRQPRPAPRRLIVFTGLSGSGKSSLAFDTIFAEGQRRYVESLSSYARQFLGQMDKPDVDFIEGLSPGGLDRPEVDLAQPALDRRHDHRGLRLPAAALRPGRRAALPGLRADSRQTPQQIVDRVLAMPEGTRFQVLAPVVRGRKGEYVDLFAELQGKGYARARVDGVVAPAHRAAEAEEAGEAHHRGGGRPARGQGERQAAAHRLGRDRAAAGRRHGRARLRRPARGRPAPRAAVLRAPGLPERPPARDRGPGAAVVLVQLAVRRLPGVHRPRHQEGGRPGAGRPRPGAHASREGAIQPWSGQNAGVLPAPAGGARRRSASTWTRRGGELPAKAQKAILHGTTTRCTSATATGTAASGRTTPASRAWSRSSSAGTPTPSRTGRGAVRGLHARGAVPGLRRRGSSPRCAVRGQHSTVEHRRGVRDVDRRVRGVPRRDAARRPPADDRRAGAQGDHSAARGSCSSRAGLPVAGPAGGHAVRRRGAADPAGHPDRLRPGRRAVRARRAVDRPAPAGQPPADRDADPAARPGQHADRGRARRGHHPHRRLGGRHRPGRRRARRQDRRTAARSRTCSQRDVAHRGVPVRPPVDPAAPAQRRGRRPDAS